MIYMLYREQVVNSGIDKVWDYFSTPKNLNAMTPGSLQFRIISDLPEKMYLGQIIQYKVKVVPLVWSNWLTEIKYVEQGRKFVDEQRIGPYKRWFHEHIFIPLENNKVKIIDRIHYDIGFGIIGSLLNTLWIKHRLNDIFKFRFRKVSEIFNGE
ncbi:MAG: hypothetical protein AB9882_09680 [Ignavibacteriaceae bacterium]